MNLTRPLAALALAASLGACASAPKSAGAPPAVAVVGSGSAATDNGLVPVAADTGTTQPAVVDVAPATDVPAASLPALTAAPVAGAGVAAEDDYASIYGEQPYNPVADPTLPAGVPMQVAYDPWEPFNRKVHAFNNVVDKAVARPLARTYVRVIPRPVRLGVSNFFNNLGGPVNVVNALLQGKPRQSIESLGRFVLNSTLGIAGIFDPASDAKMRNRSEDFGQTLGVWGWQRSRYVELPFLGPRTIRDVVGIAGDAPLSPIQQIEKDKVRIPLQGLQLVDVRAQLLPIDSLREGATDEYALYRDAWLQRRNYQINDDRAKKTTDQKLPDYLLEEESNPTVPADAIPMVPTGGVR